MTATASTTRAMRRRRLDFLRLAETASGVAVRTGFSPGLAVRASAIAGSGLGATSDLSGASSGIVGSRLRNGPVYERSSELNGSVCLHRISDRLILSQQK